MARNSFGFKSKLAAVPSLALGATAVSPLEMARAYSVFKTGGNRIEPYFIRRVIAPNGDVVKRYGPRIVRNVMDSSTARTMDSILYKAAHYGTGSPVTAAGAVNARGKTGTTNDYRDAWFCGYTDRFVGIGWVGGEVRVGDRWEYRAMARVYGGPSVGPFWGRIVKKAQTVLGESKKDFEPYYMEKSVEVEADPDAAKFEELPPLDNGTMPPINDGTTDRRSEPPQRNTAPPTDEGRTLDIIYVEVCADTGAVATLYCPERVKKPYLDGSQPRTSCPQHKPPH
jgi:penicillin-binding protein 1A